MTLRRCPWVKGDIPVYTSYHDNEWGRLLRFDGRSLFELLCLESQQAGLSWLVVLRKREGYRRAFGGFLPSQVAAMDLTRDVERLLAAPKMTQPSAAAKAAGKPSTQRAAQAVDVVRNRAKLETIIRNARAYEALTASLLKSVASGESDAQPSAEARSRVFADYLWRYSYVDPKGDGAPSEQLFFHPALSLTRPLNEVSDFPTQTPAAEQMSKALRIAGFRFIGPTTCYAFMQSVGMVNDHFKACFCMRECEDARRACFTEDVKNNATMFAAITKAAASAESEASAAAEKPSRMSLSKPTTVKAARPTVSKSAAVSASKRPNQQVKHGGTRKRSHSADSSASSRTATSKKKRTDRT